MENQVAEDQTLDVLTEDELALVVGGGGTVDGVKAYVYNKIGMCECGLAH